MRKFSQINEAKTNRLEIQNDTVNYISTDDLDKYLNIAGKFIMPETKEIVNWLKVNNDSYLHTLDPDANEDNALAAFYNAGVPKDEKLKRLYALVGKVVKAERIIEIPVFQTKEQFESIINKKVSPDEVLLDLTTEKGRSDVYKKYQPLIHKIVNQFYGKSSLPREELYAVACEGLVEAMNAFGHPKVRDPKTGKWVEVEKDEKHASYSFTQFAAQRIRTTILAAVENSHLVRIAKSAQKKEREEKGHNTKSNTVSGNKTVGHDSEGNGKTLFDYIEDSENGGKSIDAEDLMKLWKKAYARLESKFPKEDMEFFYRVKRLNGYEDEKKNQKELAAEYGLKPSTANIRLQNIVKAALKDKVLKDIFTEILELTHECKQDKYREEDNLSEEKKLPAGLKIDVED